MQCEKKLAKIKATVKSECEKVRKTDDTEHKSRLKQFITKYQNNKLLLDKHIADSQSANHSRCFEESKC